MRRDGRKLLARDRICSRVPWYIVHIPRPRRAASERHAARSLLYPLLLGECRRVHRGEPAQPLARQTIQELGRLARAYGSVGGDDRFEKEEAFELPTSEACGLVTPRARASEGGG